MARVAAGVYQRRLDDDHNEYFDKLRLTVNSSLRCGNAPNSRKVVEAASALATLYQMCALSNVCPGCIKMQSIRRTTLYEDRRVRSTPRRLRPTVWTSKACYEERFRSEILST